MSWIEKLRAKPQAEKVKLIWVAVIVAAIVLVALWIVSSQISKNQNPDTTLFKTLGRGINDIRDNFRK